MSEYSAEMEATIRAASTPLTFAKAQEIANTDAFVAANKSHRSVIAKAKSMGLDYEPKPAVAKRPKGITKATLVQTIADQTGLNTDTLTGLDKANMGALTALVEATA